MISPLQNFNDKKGSLSHSGHSLPFVFSVVVKGLKILLTKLTTRDWGVLYEAFTNRSSDQGRLSLFSFF